MYKSLPGNIYMVRDSRGELVSYLRDVAKTRWVYSEQL